MKFLINLIGFLSLIGQIYGQCTNGYNGYAYTIVSGDSFNAISQKICGTNACAASIASASGLTLSTIIYPNNQLCIPYGCCSGSTGSGSTGTGSCPGGTLYTVVSGDSFNAISAKFCSGSYSCASSIASSNGLTLSTLIYPNEQLCVPSGCCSGSSGSGSTGTGSCPGGSLYTVVSGDSFNGISAKFCSGSYSCASSIASSNGLTLSSIIQPTQQLCVPSGCCSGSMGSGSTGTGSCPGGTLYTVVSGDSFNAISAKFCSGSYSCASSIASSNGLTLSSIIQPTQQLCVPSGCCSGSMGSGSTGTGSCPGGSLYTVVSGDSFNGISAKFCSGSYSCASSIASSNGLSLSSIIQPNQQLCVPSGCCSGSTGTGSCPGGTLYTVVSGDSFNGISSKFCGGSYSCASSIASSNGLTLSSIIQPNQQLCVPDNCCGYASCPAGTNTYYATTGQTLSSIASFYCNNPAVVNAGTIASSSGFSSSFNVYSSLNNGQMVCIPNCVSSCPSGTVTYYAAQGQTLNSIASSFCNNQNTVNAATIAASSGISSNFNANSALFTGQMVCIPQCVSSCPNNYDSYYASAGQTLSSIANMFCNNPSQSYYNLFGAYSNVPAGTVANQNTPLYAGQLVCVPPCVNACPYGYATYYVQSGNTLASIANSFCNNPSAAYINSIGASSGLPLATTNPNTYNFNAGLNTGEMICVPPCVSSCPYGYAPYIVQSGQTLNSIASTYCNNPSLQGTYVNQMLASSGIATVNANSYLYAGEQICLPPCFGTTAACPAGYGNTTVGAGQSLSTIANIYCPTSSNVATAAYLNALQTANYINNPNIIATGQLICLPPCFGCGSGFVGYTVPNNVNTVSGVASAYCNSATPSAAFQYTISSYNGITNANPVYPGEVLCVPGSGSCFSNNNCPSGVYTVSTGVSCATVEAAYGISQGTLTTCNPGLNCNAGTYLTPGTTIFV